MMALRRAPIQFGTLRISYRLLRSDRKKTLSIAVDPVKGVIVTAPKAIDAERVHELASRRASWIASKLRELGELKSDVGIREFVSGESFPYLGRNHRLKLVRQREAGVSVRVHRGRFEVRIDSRLSGRKQIVAIRDALSDWYREHAANRLAERAARLSARLGVTPPAILIRDQQKRWASCDRRGRIRFNWRIVMAPMSLVDYVIAHELCHLIRNDHSPAFWKLLRTLLPDYEVRRERLKVEGRRFSF
jgi:predicted metal-dependent hydrolase